MANNYFLPKSKQKENIDWQCSQYIYLNPTCCAEKWTSASLGVKGPYCEWEGVKDLVSKRKEGDVSVQVWRFSDWDVVILSFISQFWDKHAMLFSKMLFFLVKSLQYKFKRTIITSQLYLDYLPPAILNEMFTYWFIIGRNEVGARLYFHRRLWFCPQGDVCGYEGGCAWLPGGWGMRGCGGHAWLQGGMHGCQGACVVAGGMHGCQGVCMVASRVCVVAG